MAVAKFNTILLLLGIASLGFEAVRAGSYAVVDIGAKKAKTEVVDEFEVDGIKVQKLKDRECALQECSEVSDGCGWCSLSNSDPELGFGFEFEMEEQEIPTLCLEAGSAVYKPCNFTRAVFTVEADCPGTYILYPQDCPVLPEEPKFRPVVIPGTAENAPAFLPSANVIKMFGKK